MKQTETRKYYHGLDRNGEPIYSIYPPVPEIKHVDRITLCPSCGKQTKVLINDLCPPCNYHGGAR